MTRHYLADVIGTGEADVDEFRPAVADYPMGWRWCGVVPLMPVAGSTVLTEVRSGDLTLMIGDARIDALASCPLTTPTAQIDPAEMAAMRAALDRRGIGSDIVDGTATYGDIINILTLRANVEGIVPAFTSMDA